MSSNISQLKQKTRKLFQARYKELKKGSFKSVEKDLEQRLTQLGIWREGLVVASYIALPDEISLARFHKKHKPILKFVFPKMTELQDKMQFFYADPDKKTDWEPGPWKGSLQPAGNKEISLPKIDVFLIPAQALDRRGRRLGRGGGFYDRTLSSPELRALKIAISASYRISNADLPEEDHDVFMDIIATNDFIFLPLGKWPNTLMSLAKGTNHD